MTSSKDGEPSSLHKSKKQKTLRQGYIYDGQNRITTWPEEQIRHYISVSTRHLILSVLEQYTADLSRIESEWTYITTHTPDHLKSKLPKQLKLSVNGYQYLTRKMTQITLHEPNLNTREQYDFANASFIYDSNPKQPVFIASQSPMPSTITQFWKMVWEWNVSTIVMLSVVREKGDVKGCRYWPKEGIVSYGQFEICVVSKHAVCPHYLVRSFYIKDRISGSSRTLTQFQYKSWNDVNNTPANLPSFLEFRRKIQRSNISCKTPTVVHCRDGLGRTGMFILLELALRKLVRDGDKIKELDPCALLEFLRDQRPGLVSNKQQYQFFVGAFCEEVHAMMKVTDESGKHGNQLLLKLQQQLLA
ncbi:hypothetical protein ACHWQZ_G011577 [Mnemiopsis leidyi]